MFKANVKVVLFEESHLGFQKGWEPPWKHQLFRDRVARKLESRAGNFQTENNEASTVPGIETNALREGDRFIILKHDVLSGALLFLSKSFKYGQI